MTETGLSSLGPPHPDHADYGAGELIVCDRLVRIYTAEGIEVQALQGLDLLVPEGELTALVGASGSGCFTGALWSGSSGSRRRGTCCPT
jgi:hypothetical protein